MGPYDQWVSECAPCRWALFFDTQDEAINAAVDHVAEHHADMDSHSRGIAQVGHVQLRTITLDENGNAVMTWPAVGDTATTETGSIDSASVSPEDASPKGTRRRKAKTAAAEE